MPVTSTGMTSEDRLCDCGEDRVVGDPVVVCRRVQLTRTQAPTVMAVLVTAIHVFCDEVAVSRSSSPVAVPACQICACRSDVSAGIDVSCRRSGVTTDLCIPCPNPGRGTGASIYGQTKPASQCSNSNRIGWAPFHRTMVPRSCRFSRPDVRVMKWLPASWPILLLKWMPP